MTQPTFPAPKNILENIVKQTFNKRRKMIRHTLKGIHVDINSILLNLGIDPVSRPEDLSVEQFCKLASKLNEL